MNPISLPVSELKPALAGLGKIINRHSKLPVLGCIKIERTAEGWIALTSTDLDHFVTMRLEQPADGGPLTLLVPHHALTEIAKPCNRDERIMLEPKGEGAVSVRFALAGQLGEQTLKAPAATEFPATPKVSGDPVPVPDPIRHVIHQAMQCASEDPTRYVLQGVFVDVSQPTAHHIVGTDGKHLYSANSWQLPLKHSLIIPKHKFLSWSEFNKDGEWQLKVEGPMLQINSRRWRFITKQIEGNYPKWREVLPNPKDAQSHFVIDPAALGRLIQTIERLPCDNPEHFTIGIQWKDQQLTLLGRAPQSPDWTRVMIQEARGDGKNVTIFLNRHLLIKALEFGLNSVGIIDPMSPMRCHQGSREMIIMPVRPEMAEAIPPSPRRMPKVEPKRPVNGSPVNCSPLRRDPNTPRPAPMPSINSRPANETPLPAQRKPAGPSRPRPRPSAPPRIDDALEAVGGLREAFQSGLAAIRGLTAQLRGIKTSHRATEKEVETVRSKVRSLQNFKL